MNRSAPAARIRFDVSALRFSPIPNYAIWSSVVAVGWALMVGWAASYVIQTGRNLPMQDEWEFIPPTLGITSGWAWAFEKHYEHHFILGRLIYVALHRLTGNWFPAGMVANIIFLALSALISLRVARRLRGQSHPADLWLSVLLLSIGNYENLLMGYQVAYTATTLLIVGLLAVVTLDGPERPARSGSVAGVLLLGLMLGGGHGLLFVPAVSLWIGYQLLRAIRQLATYGQILLVVLPALLANVFFAVVVYDVLHSPTSVEKHGVRDTVLRAMEFLAEAIGPYGNYRWPVLGCLVAAIEGVTIIGLLGVAVRRPAERPVVFGWLAVLASIVGVALAVGHIRPSGFASRYTCISSIGLCVTLFALARYVRLPKRIGLALTLVLLVLGGVPLCRGNWQIAKQHAWYYRIRYELLASDLRAGMPLDFVADRNVLFPVPAYRDGFKLLSTSGFTPLTGNMENYSLTSVSTQFPPQTRFPAWNPVLEPTPGRFRLPIETPKPIAGIRFRYYCDDSRYWQQFKLKWVSATTGTVRESVVYPWLVPGESTLSFWLDDTVAEAWVEPGTATTGLRVISMEVFTKGR